MAGVDIVADAVKGTLGASGYNAVIESNLPPYSVVTNDGVSIARSIELDSQLEQVGANLIKEIANRSDREGGDGTTTSTVLAQAILHAGADAKESPMSIKRSLDECLPLINASLDTQTRQITPEQVLQVATVSSESEELGKMLQEIYKEIGKDGIVELDNSNLPETFFEIGEGVRLRGAGFFGAYSTTETGKAVYKNPTILVTNQKINTVDEIEPIITAVHQAGKNELVIYCDDIDMGVASRLAFNHLNGGFKTLIIKAPTLWKDWITDDFARITGATVIDPKIGITWKTVRMSNLGTCDKLITTKDETRVIGIQDISDYVKYLTDKGDDESKLHASWLQTKVATLKLGANSDSELSYKRLKAEDARNASYQALQDGIVPGGGVALLVASQGLPDTIGGRIMREALQAPMRQIMLNAGAEAIILPESETSMGFDVNTHTMVDMWEAGIVDPVKVTKTAIKNALSVAGTVLTTKIVVTLPKLPPNANTPTMPGM